MTTAEQRLRTVILTEAEPNKTEWLAKLLTKPKMDVIGRVDTTAQTLELVRAQRPDLLLVDRDIPQAEAIIRQSMIASPATLCIALVANPDVPALRRLMGVGARDVLPNTASYADVIGSIRQVVAAEIERRRAEQGNTNASSNRGKLIVLIAPKGGVGTTTIATNLAIALGQICGQRKVALADFSLQFGDVGVHLNLRSKYAINDLTAIAQEIEETILQRVISEHSSGIDVLLAPAEPDAAAEVTGSVINSVLDAMLHRYSYVVADTWSFLDEISETLLRRADEVLLVTTPELPTLKNAKRFLEFVMRHELTSSPITIVLNRFPSIEGISLQDVQEHLLHPVGANIPSEGQLVTHSINRGVPLFTAHPKSWAAQSLRKLAARITGDNVETISLSADGSDPHSKAAKRKSAGWPFRLSRNSTS